MTSPDFLDFPEVAGLYSQLAGVLAGFAFAALIAVATVRLTGSPFETYVTTAYRPLMCSFFSLVAASLNYAIVAGEASRTGRAAAVEATAGVSFCAAGCLLIFSIFVTLDSVEVAKPDVTGNAAKAVQLVRRILTTTVPPLFVLLFMPALRDHSSVKYGTPSSSTALNVLAITLVVISAVSGGFLFVRFERLSHRRYRVDLLSVPGVVIAILATLATGAAIAFLDPTTSVPDAVPVVEILLVAALGIVTSIAACRFQADGEDPNRGPTPSPVPVPSPRTEDEPVPTPPPAPDDDTTTPAR